MGHRVAAQAQNPLLGTIGPIGYDLSLSARLKCRILTRVTKGAFEVESYTGNGDI